LPAPLGPISAWISPGLRSSVMSSVALSAPNALLRFLISRTGSAMARFARNKAKQPLACEQDDAEQDQAEEELPVFGDAAQREFEQHIDDGSGDRAEQTGLAAEDDEHDQLARHLPGQHRRADE